MVYKTLQNKLKDWATQTQQESWGEPKYSGSSCSTSGSCHDTPVEDLLINKWKMNYIKHRDGSQRSIACGWWGKKV